MKKLIALLLAAVMALSLAACGGKSESAQASASAETAPAPTETALIEPTEPTEPAEAALVTVTEGKLTVATSPDFAPYEFYAVEDGTPRLAGFDVALAGYIADYLGLELEMVPIDFDGVLMELQTKNVDLGLAGLSPDPKRESIMDFSDVYYQGGQSFVTVKGSEDKFPSLEATNTADFQIGAQTGSIQVDLAQENSPDAEIIQLAKVTDIIAELLAGKLDGAYIETAVAQSYAVNYPELAIVLDVPYDVSGSAVGVSKGTPRCSTP